MRKMLNKKGFSLVELMIVVVIMGILIAVAIPLYGAITDNAKNRTCADNVKTIRSNAASYYSSYNEVAKDKNSIACMFDDGKIPNCPWDGTEDTDDYSIGIDATNGAAKVKCANTVESGATDNASHVDAKAGTVQDVGTALA